MATSAQQVIPLVEVWDYVLAPGDPSSATTSKGKSGKQVKVTLQYDKSLTIAPDVVVWVAQEAVRTTLTDGNGFWHLYLVPNNKISPANTYYTVEIEGGLSYQIQVTDVAVPAPGWQSSAPGILLNIPSALAPTTSTVGALTASGLITAQAGISVTAGGIAIAAGGLSVVGGLTVDSIAYSQAVSRLIPGGTSFSVRNNANTQDNLLVADSGNVTVRGSLTVTTGPLNVSAGGAAITGNSTVTGTLTLSTTLTVSAGGVAVTGNSTITGTLTVSGLVTAQAALTVSAGNLNVTVGNLVFAAASAKIIPGATSLLVRNTADSASNLAMTDAGLATFRNAIEVPYAAATALPTHSYGTVPVKIDEQDPTGGSFTLGPNPLPTGFRHLLIEWYARGDTAAASTGINLRFNNDVGSNYDVEGISVTGTAAVSGQEALAQSSLQIGTMPANSATAAYFGVGEAKIMYYNGAVGNKLALSSTWYATANTTTNQVTQRYGGKWRVTATPITRLDILPTAGNFVTGTRFTLWGIP